MEAGGWWGGVVLVPRVFSSSNSFVMHGTKAKRDFKDEVLDTSALLIG